MADDNILGAVKIEIRGDWSKLASDFASAEGTARNLAASITGNLNVAFRAGTGLVDQFGRSTAAAGSAAASAAPQTDKLAQSVSRLATSINSTATTNRILTDALQQSTSAMREAAAAAALSSEGIDMLGASVTAALGKMTAANAGAQELRSTYLSIGLALRTIRIGEMIFRGVEAIGELYIATRDAVSKIIAEFGDLDLAVRTSSDEIASGIVQTQNKLAELSGRPPDLKALGMTQAAVDFDRAAQRVLKQFDEVSAKLEANKINPFESALTGQAATTGILGGGLSDLLNRQTKGGEGVAAIAKIYGDFQAKVSAAKTAQEQLAAAQEATNRVLNVGVSLQGKLNSYVDQFKGPQAMDLFFRGTQDATAGLNQAQQALRILSDMAAALPKVTVLDEGKREVKNVEETRAQAGREAIVPRARVDSALAQITEETRAREKASQDAIALSRETARAEIEAMRDPHQRAIADAQEELKVAKDTQAALLATQRTQVPRQTAAIQQRGALEAAGKAPEEAQAAQIGAARQVEEVNAEAALKRQEAASAVAIAEQKVTATVAQQNREIDQATQKTAAKLAATRESAALEAQALQVEREVGVAAGATGAVKITQMRAQADAQAAQRDGEVRRLQQEADAEGEQTKKAELLAQAEIKRLENTNKTYAAETKIREVLAQQAKQLAEIETKRQGDVQKTGFEQQKVQVKGAFEQIPAPKQTDRISEAQQLLAIDQQEEAVAVARKTTEGDIAALYGDGIAAAKAYAEADALAAEASTKDSQAQQNINALLQQDTFQYQLQNSLKKGQQLSPSAQAGQLLGNAADQAANGIGSAIADGLLGKHPGKSIGQEMAEVLKNTAKQIASSLISGGVKLGLTALLGFAEGGHPPVGVTSIVGENGPELFVPKEAGTIIPAGKFGSSGGSFGAALAGLPRFSNVTNSGSMSIGSFNMQVHGPSNPKQFAEEVMKHIAYRAKSQGGPGFSPLSRAFQGASGGTNS